MVGFSTPDGSKGLFIVEFQLKRGLWKGCPPKRHVEWLNSSKQKAKVVVLCFHIRNRIPQ